MPATQPLAVLDEGVLVGARGALNIIGGGAFAVDNPAAGRVDIDVSGAAAVAQTRTLVFLPKVVATTTRQLLTPTPVTVADGVPMTVFVSTPGGPSIANTAMVWIGDNTVTAVGGGNAWPPFPPGSQQWFDITSTAGIYVVAASGSQEVYVGVARG